MLVSDFLTKAGSADWLLFVTPHDPHRCGHTQPRSVPKCQREYYNYRDRFGGFCEKYGDGSPGMGVIPDWTPEYYSPDQVRTL